VMAAGSRLLLLISCLPFLSIALFVPRKTFFWKGDRIGTLHGVHEGNGAAAGNSDETGREPLFHFGLTCIRVRFDPTITSRNFGVRRLVAAFLTSSSYTRSLFQPSESGEKSPPSKMHDHFGSSSLRARGTQVRAACHPTLV
jgi:hypothetical protein